MANTIAALDFQKASGTIRKMQGCINNIHKFAGTFVGAAETALEKSTEQKWMITAILSSMHLVRVGSTGTPFIVKKAWLRSPMGNWCSPRIKLVQSQIIGI